MQLSDVTLAQSTVTIYEPDGTRLGAEAFVGKFGLFVDPRTLPESGTYTMVVDPYRDAVGAMTLELYDVPPDPEATIAPGGSPVSLVTTAPGQNARATFSAPAGARVSVRLSGVTIKSAKVALLKGSTSLASTIVGTPGGFLDVEALTSAGEYALVVDPQTSYTGAITLTLYDVPGRPGWAHRARRLRGRARAGHARAERETLVRRPGGRSLRRQGRERSPRQCVRLDRRADGSDGRQPHTGRLERRSARSADARAERAPRAARRPPGSGHRLVDRQSLRRSTRSLSGDQSPAVHP